MKILLATSAFAPSMGGVQTVCEHLALGLQARGHQVTVLTNRVPLRLPRYERYRELDLHRIWFPSQIKPRSFRSLLLWVYALLSRPLSTFRLKRLLRQLAPEVINLHHPQSIVPFFQKLYLPAVITSLHGYDLEIFVPEEARATKRLRLEKSSPSFAAIQAWLGQSQTVVANSQYTAAIARKMLAPKALPPHRVIYNAIDPSRFQKPLPAPAGAPSAYIFAFGRFDRQKGFDQLLAAFARLSPQLKYDLVIAGTGPEAPRYQAFCAAQELSGRVHFPGRATPQEVVAYLQHAALVVVPSRWEAFGITVLEALAAGQRVVATAVGGIPEFARFPHCHICEPQEEAIADAIEKALAQRMSIEQKKTQQEAVWAQFNEQVYLDAFEEVLEGVSG